MDTITLGIGDHVKTTQGKTGTINEVCEEYYFIKYDEPFRDVLGWVNGTWARKEHIQKMPTHAPQMPQDQRNA